MLLYCNNLSVIASFKDQISADNKMPKESEQPSNEEDKQPDSRDSGTITDKTDAAEELVQKQMGRNTPSPHRMTPQCKL